MVVWGMWLQGVVHGCGGTCVVAGVCMVAGGGAWLQGGGHGWLQGCVGYDEIWSMSRQYASYWNAFLLFKI